MATPATLARPYAEALFHLEKGEPKRLNLWIQWLKKFSKAFKNRAFFHLLRDPRYRVEEIANALVAFAPESLAKVGKRFLILLSSNGRLHLIPAILSLLQEYLARHEKTVNVKIKTPFPLQIAEKARLENLLKKALDSTPVLDCEVNKQLIGGIYIQIGDRVIDASLKGKIDRLKATMT